MDDNPELLNKKLSEPKPSLQEQVDDLLSLYAKKLTEQLFKPIPMEMYLDHKWKYMQHQYYLGMINEKSPWVSWFDTEVPHATLDSVSSSSLVEDTEEGFQGGSNLSPL